jgi:hypothetical protein
VTIDCPSDCPHLIASRAYDYDRKEIDWSARPLPDTKVSTEFVHEHSLLIEALSYAIASYARDNRGLVDNDVIATLEALVNTYRTLTSGIYYENPPAYPVQRGLYQALRNADAEFRKEDARTTGVTRTRDSELRDAFTFLAHLAFARSNGRPKGRAFLDLIRSQHKGLEATAPSSNIVLIP